MPLNKTSLNKVRVLHPITRLIVGGAQENTMFTAALLDKTRFETDVLSGPQTGSEGSLIEEVRQRGIHLSIMPEMVRQISPLNDFRALWKLVRLLRSKHYDIIHTHSSKAGILGRIAARLAGTPIIVHTVHGWSFHDHMSPRVRDVYIILERLTARFSDSLIVVTQADIDKGLRNGIGRPEQYRLIRSAIPLDEYALQEAAGARAAARSRLGIPADCLVLGNVGRFSPQKDPLRWVQVASRVARSVPDCRFLLVGDGPLRGEVETMLAEEEIAERTILTGLRRDVPQMLAAMDVFLLTSLWEGLPRVIPEAMSMGLPVVATAVDGSSEAIIDGQTGFVCRPVELDLLAQRCIALLEDQELREAIGQRAREYALREFDVRQMVKQIAELYEELLDVRGLR